MLMICETHSAQLTTFKRDTESDLKDVETKVPCIYVARSFSHLTITFFWLVILALIQENMKNIFIHRSMSYHNLCKWSRISIWNVYFHNLFFCFVLIAFCFVIFLSICFFIKLYQYFVVVLHNFQFIKLCN